MIKNLHAYQFFCTGNYILWKWKWQNMRFILYKSLYKLYTKLLIYKYQNYISRFGRPSAHRVNGKNNYVRSWINCLLNYGPDTLKYIYIYIYPIYDQAYIRFYYIYTCLHLQTITSTLHGYTYTATTCGLTPLLYAALNLHRYYMRLYTVRANVMCCIVYVHDLYKTQVYWAAIHG